MEKIPLERKPVAKAPISSGTASGKTVEFIAIEKLGFDTDNPRLPSSVKGDDIDAVLEWMLRDASILELMGSIGEKGYFPGEPLLVVPDLSRKDAYTVVEGNRRLCATYLLLHPEKAPIRQISVRDLSDNAREKPNKLPVLKFLARREILDYLGYRHVTGIKPWDPLAKARYLLQLREILPPEETQDEQHKALAKAIGSRRTDYVAALLTALALYNRIKENAYFDIRSLDEDSISFSLLTTALSYSNIVAFLGLTSRGDPSLQGLKTNRLKELTSWMFEKSEGKTRLGESRNLSMLNSVVSHPTALSNFKSGKSLREAALLTGMPAEIFSKAIINSMGHLKLAREQQHHVDKPTKYDEDNLREIQAMARDLRIVVSSKLIEIDS